jgi:hypothetical protein
MKIDQKSQTKLPSLKILVGLGLTLIILVYGLYEAHDLIYGPFLAVDSPIDGQTIKDPLISVNGQTKRIAKMFINGQQVFTHDDGSFTEPLLLGYGYNIIEVRVQDQFDRQIVKTMRVVLN